MQAAPFPRLVIAGLSGDAGKTMVSLALLLATRRAGIPVRAFKKGPDYIDAAWLEWASGHPARNLDSFLCGFPGVVQSFTRTACADGLNLVEGNRGLYDGSDPQGTHSTVELAKALQAPVILVVDAAKTTRTVAACVLGCQKLDPQVTIAGVILNHATGLRHQRVIRACVEADCGIPVLGAIPNLAAEGLLPNRHLGLVTPAEYPTSESDLESRLCDLVATHLDLEKLLEVSRHAPTLTFQHEPKASAPRTVTIAYFKDSAFTFYYPENLEALEAAGANILPVDSLRAAELPEHVDALYIGGGFPETHAAALSRNRTLLESLKEMAAAGLPVYAECGGLMLLSRAIRMDGLRYAMAGVLPFEVELCRKPQGHGYVALRVDRENPFFPLGLEIKGHEFHYSRIAGAGALEQTVCSVVRGDGCGGSRDAIVTGNVWAAYTHLHALGTPEWAGGMVAAAHRYYGAGKLALGARWARLSGGAVLENRQ
jgi:cobyrinic acid a,c-diamide synthase